jgi:hypothetical protein
MHRLLSKVVVSLSVLALLTPATIASAADRPDSVAPSIAVAVPPAGGLLPAPPNLSVRAAAQRAAIALADRTPAGPVAAPVRHAPRTVRAQMGGGGGKSGMIMGLVSAVVGVGASIYMYKMMTKDKDQATNGQ